MKTALIGDLTNTVNTWNPTKKPDSEFDYIELSAVDNASKTITGATSTIGSDAPSRARQLVVTGDVLVSTVRPNLNAVAVVPPELDGATASTGFTVLRPSPDLDGRFLFHWVRSPAFVSSMVRKATGASYPAVSDRIVKNSELPAPPLSEQRRIAAILDHADNLHAKRRQVLTHLDSLKQSIFVQMFESNLFPTYAAGVLMPNMRNGLSPATTGTHAAQVLTLSAITRGRFDPSATKPGMFAIDPPKDKRVAARDFLMCRGNGNQKLVGAGTCSHEDRNDLVFPDTVIAGTADPRLVTLPYLEVAWRRPEVRRQVESVARTTNGTFKVNQQTLGSVRVRIPPLKLQERFNTRIELIDRHYALLQQAVEANNAFFISLQSRAFRGEL